MHAEKNKPTAIRKRKSLELINKSGPHSDKAIRRKRSRKSLVSDGRQSESQLGVSSPVVYVSSMVDIQSTLMKSSPKTDHEQDQNPLLISDDDNQELNKKTVGAGTGEDECAVDSGACLRPSGSSIKCLLKMISNNFFLTSR